MDTVRTGSTKRRGRSAKLMAFVLVSLFVSCSDDGVAPRVDVTTDAALDAGADEGSVVDSLKPDVSADTSPKTCTAGTRTGPPGSTDGERSPAGVKYNVRASVTYDPTKAHPLLVVYAAAGGTPQNMEQFTGLTAAATQAGYIVAYVDHVSPNAGAGVDDIASIPARIASRWCVDTSRVFLTGHSDGGSVIYVMLARKSLSIAPAAIAPSAAGLSKKTFQQIPCFARPIPVMVIHSKNDTLFPGYGADARDWWVGCNSCGASAGKPLPDGCLPYTCPGKTEVQYCEGSGSHGSWPALNPSMLAFFERFRP